MKQTKTAFKPFSNGIQKSRCWFFQQRLNENQPI